VFDVVDHLDELRSWPTDRLHAHYAHLVREERRIHLERLDVLRVLDERGQVDTSVGADGESARTLRDAVEQAQALESLPAVAAAAHAGNLSAEQLGAVVRLADEESDAEWAVRAPNVTPGDLARLAREQSKPTVEEGRARHAARHLRMWWVKDRGMLCVRGELPDVLGAKFEATVKKLTEQMRPPKGQAWERWERRGADALGLMCDAVEAVERIDTPMVAAPPLFVAEVAKDGPAVVAGIPLPDAMVEQLRASASIEPVLVDEAGFLVAVGKRGASLSPKITRAVLLRDGHCRCGNCDLRYGLHVHHLRPKSWGGSDDISNLAAVASVHHPMLIPNGSYALVGNPNLPDGIRLVHVDDLTVDEANQVGLPRRRAGPNAA